MTFHVGGSAHISPAIKGDIFKPSSGKQERTTGCDQGISSKSFESTSFALEASWKKTKKSSPSLRAWASFTRDSSYSKVLTDLLPNRPDYLSPSKSPGSHQSSPHDSFDLLLEGNRNGRPRHIPIIIPSQYTYVAPSLTSRSSSGRLSFHSPTVGGLLAFTKDQSPALYSPLSDKLRPAPRYVEIKIPDWANPALERASPRSLHRPQLEDLPKSASQSPSLNMAQPTGESSRSNTMESYISRPSPERLHSDRIEGDSSANINAYSSQTSLAGMRSDYESASESESNTADEDGGSHAPPRTKAQPDPQNPALLATGGPASLSGLVCNVHRTTGREPHPLVGATTTILGDKLYVFGGRRLSVTKPQLTANLYELDLVRRHWTKLETKGDTPPPRYFHSVCSLGDTKLVCYGGMCPAPAVEGNSEAQPEVVVMSDVHFYDVPTRTWTRINTLDSPQGRYAHCAAILPSSAVFASSNGPMSAVQHNPAGAAPNQGSLGVTIDGAGGAQMVVVGGQDSENHYIEQVSIFNLRSLKWTGTTGMGRSCGAYRSVVTPLTSMSAAQVGAGQNAPHDPYEEDEEPSAHGSGAPMLIYSNYNFLDVKLELQVRLTDGTLTEKPMNTTVSPPGLRFPNGGVIDNHFVVSGTFLTSSKQEYALWALDLRTLTWSRIDAGGSIFSKGSWNRGVLWTRRNAFVILGNRRRSLVDDYNNRRINFSNICLVELEAFGVYENPKVAEPSSAFVSGSALSSQPTRNDATSARFLSSAAEDIGTIALDLRELADMDFLAIDGTRVPVNSRIISRRWGPHFISLLRESLASSSDTDTVTLRPNMANNPSRNSSITITPSVSSTATTLTKNSTSSDLPDTRSAPPAARPRLLYLPHTTPTLQALLHYLYTLTLPAPPHPLATPQIFCSLLQLARPYKIDGLLEATVERLHGCLDGRNAAAIFNAAAMGAGGGDSIYFTHSTRTIAQNDIPVRTASLGGIEALLANGVARSTGLRIDTDMANGRGTNNAARPGENAGADSRDEDNGTPLSAATDTSMSENEQSFGSSSFVGKHRKQQAVWTGALSSVVGLQKRGLRGLMEGRRMREKGREGFESASGRVGLGIV